MSKLEGMESRLSVNYLVHEISDKCILKSEEVCYPLKSARRTVTVASGLLDDPNNDGYPQFFMHFNIRADTNFLEFAGARVFTEVD